MVTRPSIGLCLPRWERNSIVWFAIKSKSATSEGTRLVKLSRLIVRTLCATITILAVVIVIRTLPQRNQPESQFLSSIETDHSYRSNTDESGDGVWVVQGRMKQVSFPDLAAILGLTSKTTEPLAKLQPKPIGWQLFAEASWWSPPMDFDELYYEIKPGSERLLARKGNEIFLQDLSW